MRRLRRTHAAVLVALLVCIYCWNWVVQRRLYDSWRSSMQLKSSRVLARVWRCDEELMQCRQEVWISGVQTGLTSCLMTCGVMPLWPRPTGLVAIGNKSVIIGRHNLTFNVVARDSQVKGLLLRSVKLFHEKLKLLASKDPDSGVTLVTVIVKVGDSVETRPRLGGDERYNLTVVSSQNRVTVRISASTFCGARHGLESLSQLIWVDDLSLEMRMLSSVIVEDKPAFTYRGLLLDTARNYLPLPALYRTLDGMAASKLNTLHWHLTDSQSWPYHSSQYPQMAWFGAYSSSKVYSAEVIRSVVEYAEERGVRILMEVDSPSHAGAGWQWGEMAGIGPLVLCDSEQSRRVTCLHPPCSQLNPVNSYMYCILTDIIVELFNITGPVDLVHLGGNDVSAHCWNMIADVPERSRFLGVLGISLMFLQVLVEVLHKSSPRIKDFVIWSSDLTKHGESRRHLDSETYIVECTSDSDSNETKELVEGGYRVILSHWDKWHLDRLPTWQSVYDHRPWGELSPQTQPLVLGGEACLWTKDVDDFTVDMRLWPQAAALAERLWTDPTQRYSQDIRRLFLQRQRLILLGLRPALIEPQWCSLNPGFCL